MSRLVERLDKVGTVAPTPLGFGTSRLVEKIPTLILVALSDARSPISALELPGDSCIVISGKVTKAEFIAAKKMAGDRLWGVWPETIAREALETVKEEGGDFFILSDLNAPAEVLSAEELGKVVAIPANVSEEMGHTLEEIPVDAVVICGLEDASPVSVKDLMQIRSVRDLTSKPVLLLRSHNLNLGELKVLQDVGIQGIILDMSKVSTEELVGLQGKLGELPARKAKRDQANAILPRISPLTQVPQVEHEEDDEED